MDALDCVGVAASPVSGAELADAAMDRLRPEGDRMPHTYHVVRSSRCRRTCGMEESNNSKRNLVRSGHRHYRRPGPHLLRLPTHSPFGLFVSVLFFFLIFLSCWISPVDGVFAPLLPPSNLAAAKSDAYRPLREKEICPSVDVRNTVADLAELENCRVVEGFVHIVLMGQSDLTGTQFHNQTYPKLREITGYLLVYRVFGLRSIGQLFPNLAVIRGQQLFFDFSLVIYENMQLQEIGLKSLTELQYGSVMIEKNPNLCYVDSIDWVRIGWAGRDHHFIEGNKASCPKCPDRCPANASGSRLCWNNDDCQKVCDGCEFEACNVTHSRDSSFRPVEAVRICCHKECAGGCTGNGSSQCDVCKHVIHEGECRESCPPGLFLYMKRRCLTERECISLPAPREAMSDKPEGVSWKAFEGKHLDECILECPAGYQEEKKEHNNTFSYPICVPCKGGSCPKICKPVFVNNIEAVQKLRGCTTIEGDLDIQIKGGDNIVQELEKNLGDIEEIRGILKVARSFPLLSLNFLKSLRNITGRQTTSDPSADGDGTHHEDEYALVVQENQNLQKLWTRQNVTIYKKMSFHFNPRLCMSLIEELYNTSRPPGTVPGPARFSETDVSPWSNGDKATCDEQVLNVTVVLKQPTGMLLNWNNFRATLADKRQLLGYIISYIETTTQDVTYYDGRNACGGDGWMVDDVSAEATDANMSESHIITNLKPYTQYAIYVQTYTVAPQQTGKRVGARSPIIYERTRPDKPDSPEDLRAYANSSSELVIEWKPPKNPNGVVTHYVVIGSWRRDDQEWIDKQDSCADLDVSSVALPSEIKKTADEFSYVDNRTTFLLDPNRLGGGGGGLNGSGAFHQAADGSDCCKCVGPKDKLEEKEKTQHFKIEFENFLHNKIYVKNTNRVVSAKKKRQIDMAAEVGNNGLNNGNGNLPYEFPDSASSSGLVSEKAGENHTDTFYQNRLERFRRQVTAPPGALTISTIVVQVRHYAEYTIEVYACHDPDPYHREPNTTLCSRTAVTSARTRQLDDADDIIADPIIYDSNYTTGAVKIGWNEPENPNGLIVKYQLEYRRTDITNSKVKRECVRRKDYIESNRTRVLMDLAPGNYCFQVRAFSLAGPGQFTKEKCFTILEASGSPSSGTIAGIFVLVLFVVVTLAGLAGYRYMKKKQEGDIGIISINPDYHKYIPDSWEVSRDNVSLVRELGQGSFGMVYEGIVRNVVPNQPEAKCAVKTVNEKATISERIQFLNEASVMKEFNSHHVVKLLGVVSKAQPTLVIMELMANGDLKTYLRSHRPDNEDNVNEGRQPPTLKCILKMAIEIADGMAYLSEKKFVHRDLAARNCMVAEDMTVKIGDFGMTRDIYETDYYRKGGKGLLPVRWMAPESLRDGVFTSQCDVWSFGVVLWEMATLASQPYQGLSNEQVLNYVMAGGVMERPEGCPDRLYVLMEMCWRFRAKLRPTFLEIIEDLLPEVPPQFANVSFYHSDAGVAARAALRAQFDQESQLQNDPSTPLQEQLDEMELEAMAGSSGSDGQGHHLYQHHYSGGEQVLQIEEDDRSAKDGEQEASGLEEEDKEDEEVGAQANERDDTEEGDEDHVPVLFPYERQAYILVRNPAAGGHSASNGNGGSRSESSKGGNSAVSAVPSEDSKGSYVSNGSASGGNGYVMGILKNRRHNIAEPL